MRRAATRLFLLLLLLFGVTAVRWTKADGGTPVALAGGALLLCGIFAGKLAKSFGLPRLTGYLAIGILLGPYVLKFIPRAGVHGLDLVSGLAVSLIALTAGTELRLHLVQRVGKKALRLCAAVCGVMFVVLGALALGAKPWLPFLAPMSWGHAIAVAALLASVLVSFSPTVTIAIVQETNAKGPFTEFMLAFVIIADLIVLIAFAVSTGIVRAGTGSHFSPAALIGDVSWELFGSLAVGALIGLGSLVYLRKVGREIPLFLSALGFVSAELGKQVHLSPLLLSLSAGALVANLDELQAERLNHAVHYASLPVFALFFSSVGAELDLDAVRVVGPLAVAFALTRVGSAYWASTRFAPNDEPVVKKNLWLALVAQAGVTFGLAALIASSFPEFGKAVQTFIVAVVTMNEMVGPILVRRALALANELGAESA